MATPTVNSTFNLNCSRLAFLYGSDGAVQGQYLVCGDYTPVTISATGGTPGDVYTVVNGVSASVTLTSGTLSAGNQIGGYGQRYVPYAQVVTTVSSLTSIPAGNYLG